jgi:HAD superfamily hydrolase (TIGR01484 family)
MDDLANAPVSTFEHVSFVLTDMDETLTYQGRLSASAYVAMERLQDVGIKVIPVTAAPAGWCDQMARMWPVDAVIGENGGLLIVRTRSGGTERTYWHQSANLQISKQLSELRCKVCDAVASAIPSDDNAFRLTSVAFNRPARHEDSRAILEALEKYGANGTINNLWVLGWIGAYDKRAMSVRMLSERYGLSSDQAAVRVVYCGDSENDTPMFQFFSQSIGMSSVRTAQPPLSAMPRWITNGPGGEGFVEAADAIIAARRR